MASLGNMSFAKNFSEGAENGLAGNRFNSDLPDDSGKRTFKSELPDDSGDKPLLSEVPNTSVDSASSNVKEVEDSLEKDLTDYFDDLKEKSEFPETIPDRPFESSDLEKLSPEEVAERREEFDDVKASLKKQWEEENGMPWPKYDRDIYSSNGKLIRKAGSDYDAHHIQPLGLGGKNEVGNITPLNAEVHYDKQGIHSPDSPYSKIDKKLGGAE